MPGTHSKRSFAVKAVAFVSLVVAAGIGIAFWIEWNQRPQLQSEGVDEDALHSPDDRTRTRSENSNGTVRDAGIGNVTSPAETADIVLVLRTPHDWPHSVECLVEVGGVTAFDALDNALRPTVDSQGVLLSVQVPKEGASLRVTGFDIAPMIGELRWVAEGETVQFISEQQIRDEAGDSVAGTVIRDGNWGRDGEPLPLLVRSEVMGRNSIYTIDLRPLVTVTASLVDRYARSFQTSDFRWQAGWYIDRLSGGLGTGHFRAAEVDCLVARSSGWRVPVGAAFTLRRPSSGGLLPSISPEVHRLTVAPSNQRLTLVFTIENMSLGRVRAVAPSGASLADAQFGRCRVVESLTSDEPGVYALLLPDNSSSPGKWPSQIDVWAPQHYMEVIHVASIPRDGAVLDVALRPLAPALVVRVEFDNLDEVEQPAVTVHAGVHFVLDDGRQPNWRWTLELPSDGKLIVYGDSPRVPSVQPQARGYDFELIERGVEDGLPLRRFKARKQSGLLIRAVNANGMEWTERVLVMITHAVPTSAFDPVDSPVPPSDGTHFSFRVGEERLVPLSAGDWLIRIQSVAPTPLFGQQTATLTGGVVEVEVAPTGIGGWRKLHIVDFTGACSLKGTTFVFGAASLAGMRDVQESAQSYAESIANRDKLEGQLTLRPAPSVAAHEDGFVLAPKWAQGRVLVMPPLGGTFYEGIIDTESDRVEVRVPTWGVSVSFAPHGQAEETQRSVFLEPGWFIAIREYRDERDLRRVVGQDYKLPATAGTATIASLPRGTYVAYYIRAREEVVKHSEEELESRQVHLDWFDAAKFEARDGAVQVQLPTTRQ